MTTDGRQGGPGRVRRALGSIHAWMVLHVLLLVALYFVFTRWSPWVAADFEEGTGLVTGDPFSADGRYTTWPLGAPRSGGLAIHRNAQEIALKGSGDSDQVLAFSPDSSRVVTRGDMGAVSIYECTSGGLLRRLEGHGHPVKVATFSSCGRRLLVLSGDGSARLWDVFSGELVRELEAHGERIERTCSALAGGRMATAGPGGTVRVWDCSSGEVLAVVKTSETGAPHVALSRDGKLLATTGGDRTVRIRDAGTGREFYVLRGFATEVNALCFWTTGYDMMVGTKRGLWTWKRTRPEGSHLARPEVWSAVVIGAAWIVLGFRLYRRTKRDAASAS